MDALQINIHAEGQDAPASFFLIHPASSDAVAGLILLGQLERYTAEHPAPAYSLTWSTGAGVGGFDFAGQLASALEQCADELTGPGALSSPPVFGDPAEEDAARYWIALLSRAVRDAAAGRVL
jgi:hypothetical protein